MINALISKILSEFILSSYPVFIKLINISFLKKVLYRFLSFSLISLLFIDVKFIKKYLLDKEGLLLSFYTLVHVFTSYKGYEILKGGVANSILFTYPLIILYFSGQKYYFVYFLILIGLILFAIDDLRNKKINNENIKKYLEGSGYMIISSITEALIYFSILKLDTNNNWNQIFISYFFGFIILIVIYLLKINKNTDNKEIDNKENFINLDKTNIFALVFNILVALLGYYLRFYSVNKINSKLYAVLSFLGIIFTYMYSYIFNQEKINIYNISGSLIIILCNIYLLFN